MKLTCALLFAAPLAFAQGPISPPPGPPAPSMKTLEEIEARTPIPKGPAVPVAGPHFTITQPGSYYLTGNVDVTTGNGINISADDVTLDLNGFTISSNNPSPANYGISFIGARKRAIIRNGHIRSGATFAGTVMSSGPGFYSGINWASSSPLASRVSGVSVTGVTGDGILMGSGTNNSCIVEGCTVRDVGGAFGIRAGVVSNCSVTNAAGTSISAERVANSVGARVDGTGTGIVQGGTSLEALGAAADKRTAIPGGTATVTISTPGSYVLAGNLTVTTATSPAGHGIVIAADDVSLDLNGFTIASTSPTATGDAIMFSGERSRISITNGNIRSGVTYSGGTFSNGPGFESGINWPSSSPRAVHVTGVSVTGVKSFGIDAGTDQSSIVQGSTVRIAGSLGIRAGVVADCSVTNGPETTIEATRIANSVGARADGSGSGLVTETGSLDDIATATSATQLAVADVLGDTTALIDAKDPRTVITALPITIATPGSYRLNGNLSFSAASGDAITITSSGVTLDLGGFSLSSTATVTGNAIAITAGNRITIRNGNILGTSTVTAVQGGNGAMTWSSTPGGFAKGIHVAASTTASSFIDLNIAGCRDEGIDNFFGGGSVFSHVTVSSNCGGGILSEGSQINRCLAMRNIGDGISNRNGNVCESTAGSNSGSGIEADSGNVSSCMSSRNGSTGISANSVTDSRSYRNNGTGIYSNFGGSISSCSSNENRAYGIFADSASITSCTMRGNIQSTDLIARGAAITGCYANTYDVAGSTLTGNKLGP